jgi:choline dehydrogenase-like flavoprotein
MPIALPGQSSEDVDLHTLKPHDVIVIGSGAGGGTLAHRLVNNGARVLLLEAGDWLHPSPPRDGEPLGTYIGDYFPDRSATFSVVGGQTKFYGAALYRYRHSDFQVVEHEAGSTPGWPITYDDLEPYYDDLEALYRVHGDAAQDATEPARTRPMPYRPLPHSPMITKMVARLEQRGAKTAPIPRAIRWEDGTGPCRLCPTCDAYLCRVEAKGDADLVAIRPALATGRLTLLRRTIALRVLTEADGRQVRGVEVERDGERVELACNRVVVSTGLDATVSLLRRSRNGAHPEGLGNAGGALGRYLAGHSTGMIFPVVSVGHMPAEHTKTFAINQYYHGTDDWRYPLGVIQMAGQMPMWREAGRLMKPAAYLLGKRALTAFYMTEALPSRESGFRFDGDRLAEKHDAIHNMSTFRKLRDIATSLFRGAGYPVVARRRPPYLWHQTGGATMGSDPATSVVSPDLEVHGIAGLHVVDASVLPTAAAVNTGLTIMALAARLGDHLAGRTVSGAHS